MGAQLVAAANQPYWAQRLGLPARTIYTHMALTARDRPNGAQPAGEYWGGREDLILALDGDVPHPDEPGYKLATRRVERAVTELVRSHAIERIAPGRRGRRAHYKVTPMAWNQPELDFNSPSFSDGLTPVDNLAQPVDIPVDNVRRLNRKPVTQRRARTSLSDGLSTS